jgi:hypothetical protein
LTKQFSDRNTGPSSAGVDELVVRCSESASGNAVPERLGIGKPSGEAGDWPKRIPPVHAKTATKLTEPIRVIRRITDNSLTKSIAATEPG